ncbi:FkbM family methyltransferase [Candidatus Electronema sp. PJ]|uniref:FkbM family methyltransferase n=1 Tax=Candidatus Electronema sp. PJ TaxID=3401572 RepID=UPI003AA9BCF0
MIESEQICELINTSLANLRWKFSELEGKQELAIDSYPSVYFSPTAKGTVAGGSAKWVRKKHNSGGIHEPGMIAIFDVLKKYVQHIETVLDIGSLYGYFSLLGAAVFTSANIYSFEMNKYSYHALKENILINTHLNIERVKLFNCAISSFSYANKRILFNDFFMKEIEKVSVLERITSFFKKEALDENMIDFITLDEFCSKYNIKPGLIKIDVEGYQSEIILGGIKTIKRFRPLILIEFDEASSVNATGKTNKDVSKYLFDTDYKLIWGDHRAFDGKFQPLNIKCMNERHECNSLAFFYPSEYFMNNEYKI